MSSAHLPWSFGADGWRGLPRAHWTAASSVVTRLTEQIRPCNRREALSTPFSRRGSAAVAHFGSAVDFQGRLRALRTVGECCGEEVVI